MTDTWWATIRKPKAGGSDLFLVELAGEPADAELAALRTEYGIPGDWLDRRHALGEPWNFSVSPGEPHPEQLWSKAEIVAAREQLEDTAGLPAQRATIRALEDKLEQAGGSLPPEMLEAMLDVIRKTKRGLRQVALDEVRAAMVNVPPSKATVRRRP